MIEEIREIPDKQAEKDVRKLYRIKRELFEMAVRYDEHRLLYPQGQMHAIEMLLEHLAAGIGNRFSKRERQMMHDEVFWKEKPEAKQ